MSEVTTYSTFDVRLRAFEAVERGILKGRVATAFGVDRSTLYRWLESRRQNGIDGLNRKEGSGRPKLLNELTENELRGIVLNSAVSHGFESDLWTVGRLHQVITKMFQVDVSKNTIWRRLADAGLTYQKPEREYYEADEEVRKKMATLRNTENQALRRAVMLWGAGRFCIFRMSPTSPWRHSSARPGHRAEKRQRQPSPERAGVFRPYRRSADRVCWFFVCTTKGLHRMKSLNFFRKCCNTIAVVISSLWWIKPLLTRRRWHGNLLRVKNAFMFFTFRLTRLIGTPTKRFGSIWKHRNSKNTGTQIPSSKNKRRVKETDKKQTPIHVKKSKPAQRYLLPMLCCRFFGMSYIFPYSWQFLCGLGVKKPQQYRNYHVFSQHVFLAWTGQ